MKVLISNIVDRYLSPKKVASTWLEATAAHLGLDHIPEISDAAHRIAHILSSNGVQDKEVAYGVAWALQKRYGTSKDRTALDKALSKCAGDYSDAIAWGQTEICQKIATDWARIAGKGFLPGKSEPAKDTSSTPSTPSSGGGGGGNCFLPGTSVSTPIGNVFIENLSDGDEVLTFDPTSGKISNRPLKATSKWFDVPEHLTIGLETGSEIRCTASHRMLTSDGFKKAGSLTPEDTLRNVENSLTGIISINKIEAPVQVMNLDVGGSPSTFIVEGCVVHNSTIDEDGRISVKMAADPEEDLEEGTYGEFMPNSVGLMLDLHQQQQEKTSTAPKTTNFEKSAHLAYKIAKGMGESEESSLCAAIFSAQATLKLESVKDLI